MSNTDFKSNCGNCKHFSEPNNILGSCRRYPTYQNRHVTDYCGEYALNPAFGALNNIVQEVTKESIQAEVAAMKPKAGRPKKNVA
jgi:hypothetical protein